MSDWWAKKLQGGAPQPPQAPRQGSTPGSTPPLPQQAPRPAHLPPAYQQPQQVPQQYVDEDAPLPEGASAQELVAHNQQRLMTKDYREIPKEATALKKSGGRCPDCDSGNYFAGTASGGGAHCYDCGYPIIQAGSGLGALGGSGIIATGGQHAARSPQYTQQLGG